MSAIRVLATGPTDALREALGSLASPVLSAPDGFVAYRLEDARYARGDSVGFGAGVCYSVTQLPLLALRSNGSWDVARIVTAIRGWARETEMPARLWDGVRVLRVAPD
jgi:hypothetical protein